MAAFEVATSVDVPVYSSSLPEVAFLRSDPISVDPLNHVTIAGDPVPVTRLWRNANRFASRAVNAYVMAAVPMGTAAIDPPTPRAFVYPVPGVTEYPPVGMIQPSSMGPDSKPPKSTSTGTQHPPLRRT